MTVLIYVCWTSKLAFCCYLQRRAGNYARAAVTVFVVTASIKWRMSAIFIYATLTSGTDLSSNLGIKRLFAERIAGELYNHS